MSQVETNPLIATTTAIFRQNQTLENLSEQVMESMPVDPFMRSSLDLETDQADIPGVAGMDKWVKNFNWSLNQGLDTQVFDFELTLENILEFAPLGTDVQTIINLESITITFENTFNAFYQGCLIMFYDPTPSKDYVFQIFGSQAASQKGFWQLPGIKRITPKNREPSSVTVPINIPYNFFQITNVNAETNDWIMKYSFGRIRLTVNVPLDSMSPTTSLSMKASIRLNSWRTAGNRFR